MTETMRSSVDTFATKAYRYILGIQWKDHIRNEAVLEMVGRPPLTATVLARQLGKLGHNLRSEHSSIPYVYALYFPLHGKRKRGRPRLQFLRYIEEVTGLTGERAIADAAQDRDGWRRLVIGSSICTKPP